MGYLLNTTDDYHIKTLSSLGWELTVCNALYPETSPCRDALQSNTSFGEHLFRFLCCIVPLSDSKIILEVGGGMGYLMKDFLLRAPQLQATMLDISPFLLQKQMETLAGFPVNFREMDFLKMSASDLRAFDLVILNENLGDFPALVAQNDHAVSNDHDTIRWLDSMAHFKEEYSLPFSANEHINIGALEIVEKLCEAGVRYAYLSEHSCEASLDDLDFPHCNFSASGRPEKISLQGHTEFTVKFSYLQTIAQTHGYKTLRGPYIGILPVNLNNKVRAALQSPTPLSDEQEILQQFFFDLHKYEYLVLIKNP